MATKKKSSAPTKGKGGDPELKKALDGMDKAAKDLTLHIKTIRKAMGNRFGTGGPEEGHTFRS